MTRPSYHLFEFQVWRKDQENCLLMSMPLKLLVHTSLFVSIRSSLAYAPASSLIFTS